MSMNGRTRLLILLLIVSLLGASLYQKRRHDEERNERAYAAYVLQLQQMAQMRARAQATFGRQEHEEQPRITLQDGLPADDDVTIPKAVEAPPVSEWLNTRTERYAAMFNNWQCDVLVVPVQVEESGFDRPNRQIMTADLALALAAPNTCVADPFLVDIALGDGLRRRDDTTVIDLARKIKAGRIVSTFAGHDGIGNMRVTMRVTQLDPGVSGTASIVAAHSFDSLHYDETRPPFETFRSELPRMLTAVGLNASNRPATHPGSLPAALPNSLDGFKQPTKEGPAAQAARLMFLGMLAPAGWGAQVRLFSKAWIALENAGNADPQVRLLRARIMFHLQERPFGLAQIDSVTGPEADGLRAVLNGNLPQVRVALARIHNPWDRLFLGLELHDLELGYQRDPRRSAEQVQQLFDRSPIQVFAALRLGDNDVWSMNSTIWMKWLLDKSFPVPDFSLKDIGLGRDKLDVYDRPDAELSALRHVYRLESDQPHIWCCSSFSPAAQASDLLDLLDSRIEFTLGRQAYYQYSPLGAYDRALDVLKRYDTLLAGSPCAEELRAWIYDAQLKRNELGKSEELNRLLRQSARLAVWWAQGQTSESNNMLWYISQRPADPAWGYLIKYTDDYPVRQYWVGHSPTSSDEQQLLFSTQNTQALANLLKTAKADQRANYLALLDSRFLGGPDSTQLRLDNLSADRKTLSYLRSQIAADPDNYRYYSVLGHLLIDRNAFAETARTMLSFPQYKEKNPNDSVALANHASSWGHALFWLGATDEARPLLKLAADYDNGSAASIESAARLALLDHDYSSAASRFLESGQHYSNLWDYDEYLSLAFASDQGGAAWPLFDRLTSRYQASDLWGGAMVAHRRAGISGEALRQWIGGRLSQLPADANRDDLLSYALIEEFTDRAIAADFPEYIDGLAGKTSLQAKPGDDVDANRVGAAINAVEDNRSQFGFVRRPPLDVSQPVPSRYALLATGLAAERAGRHADAVIAFDRLAEYYKIEEGSLTLALPYFAFAAAKTGDTLGLQHFLDGLPDDLKNYDIMLGRAVFSALAGKYDLAQDQLDKAFHNWPYGSSVSDLRSGYEYLDVCVMLSEATGDDRYRHAALRLGRTLRKVEPTLAYGHALVAYLSDEENERVEALAMALYLDPQSHWASLVPPDIHEKAKKWASQHPLFRADSVWREHLKSAFSG